MRLRRVLAGCSLLALAGCGASASAGVDDGRPRVLAAFYPYYFAAERIGGGDVSVALLTPPGIEPHDLELSPRQVASIGRADLVVYQAGFQPAVDDAVGLERPDRTLDVNAVLGRAGDAHASSDELSSGRADVEPGDGHGHAEEGGAEDLAADPHVWLDPRAMGRIARAVADALADADPERAAAYRDRADALVADLAALDRDLMAGLAGCARRDLVTNHAAFGHLAARYGLEQTSVNGITPDIEPSPRRLANLVELVREHGVATVFTETLASPRVAETLARDAGVRTAKLDPLEGLEEGSAEDYLSVMRANLAALRAGLDCGRIE